MKLLLAALLALGPTVDAVAGVWDTSTPLNTDPISQGDDRIREAKAAVQEALRAGGVEGAEAIFPGPSASSAPIFRPKGGKGSTGSRPAASVGGLYYNTTTGTIQRSSYTSTDTGAGWEDLTENAEYEAIHHAASVSKASAVGVVTLDETSNAFHVSGTEAVTSITGFSTKGIIIIRWTQARSITYDGSNLILLTGQNKYVQAGDVMVFQVIGTGQVREIGGVTNASVNKLPTRQTFTSGSGTYTTPSGARQIVIRMRGGGGGGGAAQTNAGSEGGFSSFNSVFASSGTGGTHNNGANGLGGSGGAGSATLRIAGSVGPMLNINDSSKDGLAGPTNSGRGGGGGLNAGAQLGGAGGDGEYVELIISNPAASYSYVVGAGGAGGAAGVQAGGAGGSGVIIVDEYY